MASPDQEPADGRAPPLITMRDRFKVAAALLTQVGIIAGQALMTDRPVAAGIAAGVMVAGIAGALTLVERYARNDFAAEGAQSSQQRLHERRALPGNETAGEAVTRLAAKAGFAPAPTMSYVRNIPAIAAFFHGSPPVITVSPTAFQNFNADEREAILAHEIMHGVGEHSRQERATTSLSSMNLFFSAWLLCAAPKLSQRFAVAGLYIAGHYAKRFIIHNHEWQANRGAVVLTGKPEALDSMYTKIQSTPRKTTGIRKIMGPIAKHWNVYPHIDRQVAYARELLKHAPH